MGKPLSFFNWSLKRALDTIPDSFTRARLRILFTLLLFSIAKAFIAMASSFAAGQSMQLTRGIIGLALYTVLLKMMLAIPNRFKLFSHILLVLGVFIVWTNIFFYIHTVNLVTVQFVTMIALSGYYTLGSRYGILYSILGILPVLCFMFLQGRVDIQMLGSNSFELASPGHEILVILNFATIITAHYLFYKAFSANLDEKDKINQQLQLSIAEANKLAASKSIFLSTMSHELRTPLNSVIGISELLLEDKPEERQKENLKILQFSALDLLSLINNVLDFNKVESEQLTLEAVPIPLSDFMLTKCSALSLKAQDKKLYFSLDIDQRLDDITIVSDPTRLTQLIYNLVSNAIKFTEKGSVMVKLDCVNRTERMVDIAFTIADTGIGIPSEKHETIFDLFSQAESHTTRQYGGTGLGLAIVKQILLLFNSSIKLDSALGKGSKFSFTISFPVAPRIDGLKVPVAVNKSGLSQLKILVAEDNNINRVIIEKQLKKLGLEADIFEDGKQVYQACLLNNYDVIFMDLHMPVMNGYETTKQIRMLPDAQKAGTYIIAFSAAISEGQQIQDAGFDDVLYKPVRMADLIEKLEKLSLLKP
jgi:signal transduction histidine kinase